MGVGNVGNPLNITPQPKVGAAGTPDTGAAAAPTTPAAAPAAAGDSSAVGGGQSSGIDIYHAPEVPEDLRPDLPPPPIEPAPSTPIEPVETPPGEPIPPPTIPIQEPPPPPPPPMEQVITVSGSGMGADRQFKMYPSELAAMYAILKDKNGGVMSLEEMQASLKKNYGIDTEIKDGMLVNTENGHTLIADTNGNGALDMGDMDFTGALQSAGIDPATIESPEEHLKMMSQVSSLANYYAEQVLEQSRKTLNEAVGHTAEGAPVVEQKPTGGGQQSSQVVSNDTGSTSTGSVDTGSTGVSTGGTNTAVV